MTIYQKRKNFGKKTLLIGGLVSILTGCNTYSEKINYRIEKDAFFDTVEGEMAKDIRILSGPDSKLKRELIEIEYNNMKLEPDKYPILKYKK